MSDPYSLYRREHTQKYTHICQLRHVYLPDRQIEKCIYIRQIDRCAFISVNMDVSVYEYSLRWAVHNFNKPTT